MMLDGLRLRLAKAICPEAFTMAVPAVAAPDMEIPKPQVPAAWVASDEMNPKHLLELGELYAAHIGRGLHTLAGRMGVHNKVFHQLRGGHNCRVDTFNLITGWFAQNWPSDLEWPRHIPRPSIPQKEIS